MGYLQALLGEIKRLLVWWITVAPWESGLRVRFGKKVVVMGPGVHLAIPFADRIFLQSIRMRITDLPLQTITTRDGKCLTIKGQLGYAIGNIYMLYMTLHHAEDTLKDVAAAKIAQYVSTHDSNDCAPAAIESFTAAACDLEQYGLTASSVNITDFAFVRTYRLITGSDGYRDGESLETTQSDRE